MRFFIDPDAALSLQGQIRAALSRAIALGQLPAGSKLPSTRALSQQLGVSRNTVSLAYQAMEADGILIAAARIGYKVAADIVPQDIPAVKLKNLPQNIASHHIDLLHNLTYKPSGQINIEKPADWRKFPFCFLYGQMDMDIFPLVAWRDCVRQTMSRDYISGWADDLLCEDDAELNAQIRQRIALARGIHIEKDELLITMGAQNAIYLISQLFTHQNTIFTMEDPGYPDMRNLFKLLSHKTEYGKIALIPPLLTEDDLIKLPKKALLFTTPSHQIPMGDTMPLNLRKKLLDWASNSDSLIIEDDYDFEINYHNRNLPALKSMDQEGRVFYAGSFSKSVLPGMRLGFLVADKTIIKEAKALRRLCIRHVPGNNQRALALFIALGHYDGFRHKLRRVYAERASILQAACHDAFAELYEAGFHISSSKSGAAVWVTCPIGFDAGKLSEMAKAHGILIEAGNVFFNDHENNKNYFRLGFSSINSTKIAEGITILARLIKSVLKNHC